MYYKITIQQVDTIDTVKREWKKTADSGNQQDGGAVYGYAEYPEKEDSVKTILEQRVDQLDLSAVIKAINKL